MRERHVSYFLKYNMAKITNHSWIKHGQVRSDDLWEFLSSQRTLFLMMLGVNPEIQAPWKQVSPTNHFFSSVFLLCKLYLWIFCELILLKKPPHLLQRVSALTTSKQNALKVHPLQAFTLSGIHQRVSKPTENSFSPSELPMLRSPASLCTALALPRGNTTRRAELSPHQVNRLIFIKDAVARPLLAQEL